MPLLSGPAEELEKSGMVPAVAAAPKATEFQKCTSVRHHFVLSQFVKF
jgi:hypothetical protein